MDLQNNIDFIKEHIEQYKEHQLPKIEIGRRYYQQDNDIRKRKKEMYVEGKRFVEDPYLANHKLASAFAKLLIDQKVDYSINDGLTLETEQLEIIEANLPKWDKYLKQSALNASKASKEYWLFYIKDNELKYKVIPAEQGIAVYDEYDAEKIKYFIRYYKLGDEKHAELYDSEDVTYYINDDGTWRLNRDIEPHKHITLQSLVNNNVVSEQQQGWGKPPVAELKNNSDLTTDVKPIKHYIDIYDIVNSDFANNIDDFQDVYWIVKNYVGQDMQEFTENVKKYKSIPIQGDGDARAETINIPVDARKTYLNLTKENIYRFGQGVDMDSIASSNVTNVMIKAMFANLDLKANGFETEVQEFWQQIMWFLNKYLEITNKNTEVASYLNFDRSLMMNLKELMEINQMSLGITSKKTTLENNPYVQDVKEEMERLEDEQGSIVIEESE